jgi:ornithine cyclodeaminase/alanine dehydrogenase-like protein (mu-crystallin family)
VGLFSSLVNTYVGTGVIAMAMARATHVIHQFTEGFVYGLDIKQTELFATQLSNELGYPVKACTTAEEAVRSSDVVFTQTPAASQVLKLEWLRPHATIIASGNTYYSFIYYLFG